MSVMTIAVIVLAVAGLAMVFGDPIFALLKQVHWPERRSIAVTPDTATDGLDSAESRQDRLLTLLQLIRECDAVGAKGAASKLRTAAASLVADDFLQEGQP